MNEQSDTGNRAYFAQRAAEEYELAQGATDAEAAEAHRKLQLAYLEKASTGERHAPLADEVG